MHLGPTGRTKTTEDDLWPSSRVRPRGKTESPTVTAVREIRHLRLKLSIMRWAIICTVCGLLGWAGFSIVIEHMGRPEEERRIWACAVAMDAQQDLRGPVEPCESLSPAERRSAAYEYGRMRGLW